MDRKDLDSPCREFSNRGLESVVTLLVKLLSLIGNPAVGPLVQLRLHRR